MKFESFTKYTIGGLTKTVINLLLLYILIDVVVLPFPNTMIRIVVFGCTFVLAFFLYKWVGYSK